MSSSFFDVGEDFEASLDAVGAGVSSSSSSGAGESSDSGESWSTGGGGDAGLLLSTPDLLLAFALPDAVEGMSFAPAPLLLPIPDTVELIPFRSDVLLLSCHGDDEELGVVEDGGRAEVDAAVAAPPGVPAGAMRFIAIILASSLIFWLS